MGYDTTIKIKELDKQFVGWMKEYSESDSEDYKNSLVGYCMLDKGEINALTLHKISKDLRMQLRIYIQYLTEGWKYYMKKHFDEAEVDADGYKEFHFCGWEHAKGHNSSWMSVEELEAYVYENLFEIVIIPTPDRFSSDETERERYWEKLREIREYVGDMDEIVTSAMDHEFLDFYRAKEDTVEDESY